MDVRPNKINNSRRSIYKPGQREYLKKRKLITILLNPTFFNLMPSPLPCFYTNLSWLNIALHLHFNYWSCRFLNSEMRTIALLCFTNQSNF